MNKAYVTLYKVLGFTERIVLKVFKSTMYVCTYILCIIAYVHALHIGCSTRSYCRFAVLQAKQVHYVM